MEPKSKEFTSEEREKCLRAMFDALIEGVKTVDMPEAWDIVYAGLNAIADMETFALCDVLMVNHVMENIMPRASSN